MPASASSAGMTNSELVAHVLTDHLGRCPTVEEVLLVAVVLGHFNLEPSDEVEPWTAAGTT